VCTALERTTILAATYHRPDNEHAFKSDDLEPLAEFRRRHRLAPRTSTRWASKGVLPAVKGVDGRWFVYKTVAQLEFARLAA
jgi:hypothetical protein